MSDKATIYDTRRECLIASVGDKRRVFSASDTTAVAGDRCNVWWGLAITEHEFRKALSEHLWTVTRLTQTDLRDAMADELTGDGNES